MSLNNLHGSDWQPLNHDAWIDRFGRPWKFERLEGEGYLDCYGYPIMADGTLGGQMVKLHCSDHILKHMGCPENYRNQKYGTMIDIVVNPACRRAGVGSEIIARALDWMRSRGCKGCWGYLSLVDDIYASKPFWESVGFDVRLDTNNRSRVGTISMAFE